jgi:hypothetical protein
MATYWMTLQLGAYNLISASIEVPTNAYMKREHSAVRSEMAQTKFWAVT